MSSDAVKTLDSMSKDMINSIAQETKQVLRKSGKKQLGQREVETVVGQTLRGDLRKDTLAKLKAAVARHAEKKEEGGSQSVRAGLVYPVGRIHSYLKAERIGTSVKPAAAVAIAASVESVINNVLVAADEKRAKGVKRITPHHIKLAIDDDRDLSRLLAGSTIAHGGVTPYIEPVLESKKRKSSGDGEPVAKKSRK